MNRFLRPSLFLAAALLLGGSFSTDQSVFAQQPTAGQVIISEFRLDGPNNAASDEFIEIYNNTDSPITVNSTDTPPTGQVAGWSIGGLQASGNGSNLVVTIPNGTVIPARGHYLAANSTYSLTTYAARDNAANFVTSISDTAGVGLFTTNVTANYSNATRLDSVAFTGAGSARSLYIEGTGLTPINTTPGANDQFSHVRIINNGLPRDTNNNSTDFVLVSTSTQVGTTNPTPAVLGAPGPENLSSPIVRNATIKSRLLEPTLASTASPNRVRTGTGNSGMVSFRRTLMNNTGQTINSFRFRVNDLSTIGNDGGVTTRAQLALIDSIEFTYDPDDNPGTANTQVLGTTLEAPATTNPGGGINASLRVNFPTGVTVASGSSFSVNITFNIIRTGSYRFSLNHEAVLEPVATATPFTKTVESSK